MNSDAKPNAEAALKPRRRWFRFSLRTLLIVVTLLSFAFGWMGWKVNRIRARQRAVQAIEDSGGSIITLGQLGGVQPRAVWLQGLLGDDNDSIVFSITLGPTGEIDDFLRQGHLQAFESIWGLDISGTGITDVGLAHITGLTNVEVLDLTGANVTLAGVAKLRKAMPKCNIEYTPQEAE